MLEKLKDELVQLHLNSRRTTLWYGRVEMLAHGTMKPGWW